MEAVKGEAVAFAGGTDRGGIIGGYEPIHSSIQLYLVQIITIVVLCFVLGLMMKRFNQPRVIAEVMAGVLLGPSALGQIPGFTDKLFPDESLEALTLTAHLGLILYDSSEAVWLVGKSVWLVSRYMKRTYGQQNEPGRDKFLFIIGLELDPSLLRSNAKRATILSLTGQGFTWVLSLGVSQAMMTWLDGIDSGTSFVLFIGVSLSVTAFPVLSRILTENHLLNTSVGALVISAASVDEACVWCLLALVVSTVNAGSPLDAFYVFLLLVLFVVVMLTVVRWAVLHTVRQIGGETQGTPARGVVILCFLLVLIAAWVTDFIGIDAIFGAFVAGIIVPREHSLHVRVTELVQDVVSVLLLPLYFAVSGLKTDVTLLDNAAIWGVCLLTICAACFGKVGGAATVSGLALGMTARESAAVGVLMNTRGLVELIILNIGLDAGVLTKEVMAIMVVMALVTTFMTAPLSTIIYPMKYHSLPGSKFSRRQKLDPFGSRHGVMRPLSTIPDLGEFAQQRLKLLMLVSNSAGLDSVTRVAGLFNGNGGMDATRARKGPGGWSSSPVPPATRNAPFEVHALRLLEKSDRFSSDMRALERGETLNNDSLSGILQGFLELMRIKVQTHISVGSTTDFCQDVRRVSDEFRISTVVFPWEISSTSINTQFTRAEALLTSTETQVVIAVNCHRWAMASGSSRGQLQILVPFFGGKDDVAAVLLALAIVKGDTSADLVILSFIEPPKAPGATSSSPNGVHERDPAQVADVEKQPGGGGEGNMGAKTPVGESKDVEAPEQVNRADLHVELPTRTVGHQGWSSVHPQPALEGEGETIVGGRSQALPTGWTGREVMKMADSLERVTVTPAWSLQAELGSSNPPSPPSLPLTESARIVLQFVASQATGLVICGCAGSANLPSDLEPGIGLGLNEGGTMTAPMAGAIPGQRSRVSTMASADAGGRPVPSQTWHAGKTSSRHGFSSHTRRRTHALTRSISSIAHIERDAQWDATFGPQGVLDSLVGDVVSVLMRSERSPAVLAVRANLTSI